MYERRDVGNKRPHESHYRDYNDSHRPPKAQKQHQEQRQRHPQDQRQHEETARGGPPLHAQYNGQQRAQAMDELNRKHPRTSSINIVPPHDVPSRKTLNVYPVGAPPLPPLPDYLAEAPFTHASTSDSRTSQLNYERLEFLGDAYLETIATRLIYTRFSELPVGRQSLFREKLVRNSTLAEYARMYGFDKRVRRIGGEPMSSKGAEKILGDMMEAYLGAVILSDWTDDAEGDIYINDQTRKSQFEIAEEWLTALWLPILLEEDPNLQAVQNRKEELIRAIGGRDIKIEYVQERDMYLTTDGSCQQYVMGVYLTGWGYEMYKLGEAVGVNKKEAGMRASADALDKCKEIPKIREIKLKADGERKARQAREKAERMANGDVKVKSEDKEDGSVANDGKDSTEQAKKTVDARGAKALPGLGHVGKQEQEPKQKSMADMILESANV